MLTARVAYDSGGGTPVVQTQQDSFFVDVNQQGELAVEIRPNPTRTTLDQTRLHFDLRIAGELQVDIYSLEGERVSSSTRQVSPPALSTRFSIPIVPSGTPAAGATDLASGAYVVRVLFRGVTGETTSATATLAVLR
jgi:hypothetical protein